MTPETIIEQANRARRANEQCGWVTYDRQNYAVEKADYDKHGDRISRAAGYLGQVLAQGVAELRLTTNDEPRVLPLYIAQHAINAYGFQQASILEIRKTIQSDMCTEVAEKKIRCLNSKDSVKTQLFIPDFRVKPKTVAQGERYNMLLDAVKNIPSGYTFGAILLPKTS